MYWTWPAAVSSLSAMTVPTHDSTDAVDVAGAASMSDYIDRLITIEMRNRAMPHGTITPLYDAARAEGGGEPLTLRAAAGLVRHVRQGDNVVIVTGAGSGELIPQGENDGPVGAAVLARALLLGLGATPVYACESHHVAPILAASEAAGVPVRDLEITLANSGMGTIAVAPTDEAGVEGWATDLFDRLRPSAIISIERLGPNRRGVIHGATGIAGWLPQVDLTPLFTVAAARGVFSIGIGDAGNEIGFGRIPDTVRHVQPYGDRCQCPCGGGMATVVPTDVLVVAAVSNWGGYGIEAALSLLLGRADLPHSPAQAERILVRCTEAGGIEAMHCTQTFSCDGIAGESHVSIVRLLGEMVRIDLQRPTTGALH
jgi:D-glutamate cyclase